MQSPTPTPSLDARHARDKLHLTARMLNEFVYCPRLFYYEFVEGIFVHNADTLEGKAQHKRADQGKGRLQKAAQSDETGEDNDLASTTIHSRSVMLGSDSLGVTAKMDLVEANATESGIVEVRPVEYKKGAPYEQEDGITLWDADKMQLGVQIIVLRDNGYRCNEGILFYRETRQRVTFKLDASTEQWIRAATEEARRVATGPIPAPLDSSPKCPRCSLVGVCLPDETTALQDSDPYPDVEHPQQLMIPFAEEETPLANDSANVVSFYDHLPIRDFPSVTTHKDGIRRLIAPDHDTRAFYVHSARSWISKKGETLVVKEKSSTIAEVLLKDIHHLALFGPAQLSTAAVQTLCDRDIPISYFSMNGWFYGMTRGHQLKNVFTRIQQFAAAADPSASLSIARQIVYGKIRNQRTLMMRNHIDPPRGVLRYLKYAALNALNASSIHSLLGIEGSAALTYFQNFSGLIKNRSDPSAAQGQEEFTFQFTHRNRRPPRDAINALLSLGYSLLVRDCTQAALAVGFDPYIGVFHQPRYGRPALALDLMEEFRPLIVDSVVLTLVNNRMLQATDFIRAGNTVNLSQAGRKAFFMTYEKRLASPVTHPVFGYKVSYRRAIELQFRLLAKVLTGEIPLYIPLVTR